MHQHPFSERTAENHITDALRPLSISAADIAARPIEETLPFRLAVAMTRQLPRGRGALPRWLGRTVLRNLRSCVRTRHGALLAVEPSSLDVYVAIAIQEGTWDYPVLQTCRAVLRPSDVFFDVGANAGYMSIETSKLLDDQIEVFAFEPQPRLAHNILLSAACSGLSQIRVFQVMVGKHDGTSDLHVPAHSIHASAYPHKPTLKTISCAATTLDKLVSCGEVPPPNLVKLDVEGGEDDVFEGARSVIERHKPYLMFEDYGVAGSNKEASRRARLQFLTSLVPYSFYSIDAKGLTSLESGSGVHGHDLLAVPPGVPVPTLSE